MDTCCETICKHRLLFPSIEHLAWLSQGRLQGNKNVVKIAIFGLTNWFKHRITRKLLKIDRNVRRGVWQALNCLSIHATYCVIVAGASPGETKMWAAVRENDDFFTFVDHVKTNKHMLEFFSPSGSHTILVYRSYTDTKHRAASLRQQSFLLFYWFDTRWRNKWWW